MIMEIIRASRSSVSLLSGKSDSKPDVKDSDSPRKDPVQTPPSVVRRSRRLQVDAEDRPKSMLANFNFKSINLPKFGSEA